jgi:hypothetical protein
VALQLSGFVPGGVAPGPRNVHAHVRLAEASALLERKAEPLLQARFVDAAQPVFLAPHLGRVEVVFAVPVEGWALLAGKAEAVLAVTVEGWAPRDKCAHSDARSGPVAWSEPRDKSVAVDVQ